MAEDDESYSVDEDEEEDEDGHGGVKVVHPVSPLVAACEQGDPEAVKRVRASTNFLHHRAGLPPSS